MNADNIKTKKVFIEFHLELEKESI